MIRTRINRTRSQRKYSAKRSGADRLVKLALLAAVSLVLVFVAKFPVFPAVAFLEYDFADVPILIGTFMFGPLSGLMITAVVSVLQAVSVSAGSGWIGGVMHFCATGAMVLVAGCIYKKFRTLKGAVASLVFGALTMILVMLPLNMLMTPLFLGNMPYKEAQKFVLDLLPLIFAFNAVKACGNSIITFLLYKAVSKVLKKEFIHTGKKNCPAAEIAEPAGTPEPESETPAAGKNGNNQK